MLRYVQYAMVGAGLASCAPHYARLGPLDPSDAWAPGAVHHIDVRGVDVAYIDEGPRGGTPIVLVHGLSSWMGFWEYQVADLSRDHRVLALDLPGYGASGHPDAPYSPPWYADLIDAWLDQLGVDRAVVVGHSMGGQISITLALNHPERVDRLVLSAPAGIETFKPGAARWMKTWWHEERALEATPDELRGTFYNAVFNRRDPGVERLLEERVRMGMHPSFEGTAVAVSRSIAGMVNHPVHDRLGELRQPTLLVFGTDDKMIPNPVFTGGATRAVAEEGRRLIPNCNLVMLRGAGHTVHHDDPAGFNAAVRAFLSEKR
ncbi:MAG TPA: alpha/beta fold hydrolase [Myxococcota bacterium]|nr:alpha/beta fold hydrolase [Myxococcota bacterium]